MEDVAVIVGTFGDAAEWLVHATHALESVQVQTSQPRDTIWVHADSLHEARNQGAALTDAEWLIFLDADDRLHGRYIATMMEGTGDIRQPATQPLVNGVVTEVPVVIQARDLKTHNYLVIGSMVRHELFDRVGGFTDLPCLEDWDFWLRCWIAGAEIGTCRDAIYQVALREDSRNGQQELHNKIYSDIRIKYEHEYRQG